MNTRKIKLALTAGLINESTNNNPLVAIKGLMKNFAAEAGSFLDLTATGDIRLGSNAIRKSYALNYENCTLNVDLVSQADSNRQSIQRFSLL